MKCKTDHLKMPEKPVVEESEPDCSCELLDTSLSGVGDSDCSCSECLEANLEAFNELKKLEEEQEQASQNKLTRRASSRVTLPKQPAPIDRNLSTADQRKKTKLNNYRSIGKANQCQQKFLSKRHGLSTSNLRQEIQQPGTSAFSRTAINDYLKITQYRAREYLNQRKKLEKSEKLQRERLKEMIKMNLQELKFTVAAMKQEGKQHKEGQFQPHYKWNHQPYHCKSRVECRKLVPYDPDLDNKKQEIDKIKERIKQYQEKHNTQKYQCPDQCPNHHLRTSDKQLAQIQNYIKRKAKAYEEKKKKQKAERLQKQRAKAAKLRAIDIRCRDIVAKSKKFDPNVSRTSFHLTIDHFSTFSDLRQANVQRLQQKQKKRKVRKAMKEGGFLEQQIYENLSNNLIGDHPPIHSKLEAQSRIEKMQNEESQQWCQKIVKDARIKPPKDVKKEDKHNKAAKQEDKKPKQERQVKHPKSKKEADKNLRKEEERRRELQMEIDRRRQEIFKEYQKRNTTAKVEDSKNKKIRMEYEQSLRDQKPPSSKPSANRRQQAYDSYRQVYKNQPSKDPKQMKVVGDPLMHEYEYEKSVGRWKEMQVEEDREIFTKSSTSLKNKQYLKV